MDTIKLPKPFGKIIQAMYINEAHSISEAYVDEREHLQLNNGVMGLRSYLGVDDNQTLCDCYCVITKSNNKKEGVLIEDKNSKHQRNPLDAKRQLEATHQLLKNKNKEVTFAVMSNLNLIKPLLARMGRFKLKVVTNSVNGREIHLYQSDIPILYY